ncbi:hypothetical protein TNCV_1636461 [Trichonephila clavipes]|uniref:Uncharacterized protein n=1 Tax=Trichonephila clavipes TaxID=2585209 RepID=A0A8X6V6C6_TRICX|nr:hypothetical protein TNCV_1636461 [Trichonephila clavipes]
MERVHYCHVPLKHSLSLKIPQKFCNILAHKILKGVRVSIKERHTLNQREGYWRWTFQSSDDDRADTPSPNFHTTPMGGRLIFDIFNVHRPLHSSTRLELTTRQTQVRCLDESLRDPRNFEPRLNDADDP